VEGRAESHQGGLSAVEKNDGASAGGDDLRVDLRHGEVNGMVRRGSKGQTRTAQQSSSGG
jgi:hypothetical protein